MPKRKLEVFTSNRIVHRVPKVQRLQLDQALTPIIPYLPLLDLLAVHQVCKEWKRVVEENLMRWVSEIPLYRSLGNRVYLYNLYELYIRGMIDGETYNKAKEPYFPDEEFFKNYDLFFVLPENRKTLYVPLLDYDMSCTTVYGLWMNFWGGNFQFGKDPEDFLNIDTDLDQTGWYDTIEYVSDRLKYELLKFLVYPVISVEYYDLFIWGVPISIIKKLSPENVPNFPVDPEHCPDDISYLLEWIDFLREYYSRSELENCHIARIFYDIFRAKEPLKYFAVYARSMKIPDTPSYFAEGYEKGLTDVKIETILRCAPKRNRLLRKSFVMCPQMATVVSKLIEEKVYRFEE